MELDPPRTTSTFDRLVETTESSAPISLIADLVGDDGGDVVPAARRRRWRAFARNRLAVASAVLLALVVLVAIAAPLVSPYDPPATDLTNRFAPPGSTDHLLGSDELGRDLLSRLIFGARVSLVAGLGSVLLGLVIAIPLGLWSGYYPGKVDAAVMWVVDAILSIPPLVLVFAVAGVLGAGLGTTVIALSVYFTPLLFRLVRGEVHAMREGELVAAEKALGAPSAVIMRRHILPNIASPLIIEASLAIGVAIIAEASLSFLGLGVQPPTSSWGLMLSFAFNQIQQHPWMIFIPGTAVAVTVLALNLLGDGLRDALGRLER